MKINIICAGRVKESYYKEAVAEYIKRLSPYATIRQIDIDELNLPDNLRREGEKILAKLEGYVIVLDRQGKQLDSQGLATHLNTVMNSNSTLSFVIGSSDGLDTAVKQRAHLLWSLGHITLPHSLARVVLCEQIYRAFTIIKGGKYHR